jgi:hypothetical protein
MEALNFWMGMYWPHVVGIMVPLVTYRLTKKLAVIIHYRWLRKYKLPD